MTWFVACLGFINLLFLALGYFGMLKTRQLHQQNQAKAQFWDQLEQSWEPLLAGFLVRRFEKQAVWDAIPAGRELYFVDYLLRRALRGNVDLDSLQILAAPFLPALTGRLRSHQGDPEQRARAVQTFSLLGQSESQGLLAQALEDPSPLVALMAAMALSQQGALTYTKHILVQLPRLADWHMGLLISLLTRMGDEILPELHLFLDITSQSNAQTVCLQVMTRLNDSKALPTAVRLLSHSSDINVQVAALNLIGQVGNEDQFPLLRSHYDSPHFAVRLAVIRALHSQKSTQDQAFFQKAFDDSSRWVAIQAAQALRDTGNQHVLHEMNFLQHPRAGLANQVLNSFENTKDLEQSVTNPEFKHQIALLFQKFHEVNSKEIQQLITRLFFSPMTHPEVRYAMACEFSRFRNYQFFYQTLSSFILGSGDRLALIRALQSFSNPESVPALIDSYRNGATQEEQLEIIDALGMIDSSESFAFLSRIYNDLYEHQQLESKDHFLNELNQRLASALARKMTI